MLTEEGKYGINEQSFALGRTKPGRLWIDQLALVETWPEALGGTRCLSFGATGIKWSRSISSLRLLVCLEPEACQKLSGFCMRKRNRRHRLRPNTYLCVYSYKFLEY